MTDAVTFPLRLRREPAAVRPACAWLAAGDDPGRWLRELVRWGGPTDAVRLYVLPRSLADRSAVGLMIVVEEPKLHPVPVHAQGYGWAGGRLLIPVDACLSPSVGEDELADLLPGLLYVLHPAIGLVGFEAGDARSAADLLAAPKVSATAWDRADPGVTPAPPLRSVSAELPPDIETLFEQVRDDISSEPLDDVPPPAEGDRYSGPLGALAKYGTLGLAGVAGALGRGLGKIGDVLGATPQRSGFSLPDWLTGIAARLNHKLQATRNREVDRLMRLLESDPDRGLKYALPFGGVGHRGQAPPGDRLTPRNTDFSLRGLRGGGPADFWDIPEDYRITLQRRYRELAERETALGRHRRAAYIYAQLLGDYHSAANVLEQGRHYREAAALYKDHLRNTLQAAQCLEKGGLLPEAIVLYLELEKHEKVGDLYALLDDREAAAVAWRRAVEAHREAGSHLEAAALLENKLADPDEALATLAAGWALPGRPVQCLRERFALLGRLGRHDVASKSVDELRSTQYATGRRILLVEALAPVSRDYPHAPLREQAADAARVAASAALVSAEEAQVRRVTEAVASLRPGDRLLRRDVHRYATRRREPESRPPTRDRPRHSDRRATLVRTVNLMAAGETEFQDFAVAHHTLLCVGRAVDREHGRVLKLVCHDLADHWHAVVWPTDGGLSTWPMFVVAPEHARGNVIVAAANAGHLKPQAVFLGPGDRRIAHTPSWLPTPLLGAAWDRLGQLWSLSEDSSGLLLRCFSSQATLVSSESIDVAPAIAYAALERPVQMVSSGDEIVMAIGTRLIRHSVDRPLAVIELGAAALSLSASRPHTVPRVAVTESDGGVVVWTGAGQGEVDRFGEGMVEPVAGFINDGHLVSADRGTGRVYTAHDRELQLVAEFEAPADRLRAVLQADAVGRFAVLTATEAHIYQMPGR